MKTIKQSVRQLRIELQFLLDTPVNTTVGDILSWVPAVVLASVYLWKFFVGSLDIIIKLITQ